MNNKRVQRFLAEKCKGLDAKARFLLTDVLLRLPEDFDTQSIAEVFSVYAGSVYPLGGKGWVIIFQWDILNASFQGKPKNALRKKQVAMGVIALNLAHYMLRHTPNAIHTKRAYNEAKDLAINWCFSRQISAMEKELL